MKKLTHFFLETIKLIALNILVKKRNFFEFLKVIKRYYNNSTFRRIDCTLLSKYCFKSPFAISKAFMEAKGESDIYVYGETPLTSLELITHECQLSKKDTVFDLGCGRGRGCFWLHSIIGCKVVGIEYIPEFIAKAEKVKQKFHLERIEFRQEDFFKTNFKGATVIYLYGTCLAPESIQKLIKKLSKLPGGTKIVTISYPLNEFTENSIFEIVKRFTVPLIWGEGEVYIQRIIGPRKNK